MAALLHDVGKAVCSANHAEFGAQLLESVAPPRVTWLVHHHLDLLKTPTATRRYFAGSSQLRDLERLRRWDLAGRKPTAWVPCPEDAIATLMTMICMQKRQPELGLQNGGIH